MTNTLPIRIALTFLAATVIPCVLPAASTDYAASVLADSPYAYYRLGESSGTSAADSSGNNRNGSYVNSPTLSVVGQGTGDTAVTFNGTNQRVLTGLAGFASLGNFSMELVLSTTTTVAGSALIGTTNTGSSTAFSVTTNQKASGTTQANTTRILLRDSAGASINADFASSALYSGNYTHLVVTFDSTLGTSGLKVYINGVAVSVNATGTFGTASAFGFAPTLGANNNRGTVGSFLAATFDEAAVYTSILSASDVSAHYQALTSIPEPSTAAILTGLAMATLSFSRRRRTQLC